MEKNDAYSQRVSAVCKVVAGNSHELQCNLAQYKAKEGLIGVVDVRDLQCPTVADFHQNIAIGIVEIVGMSEFSFESIRYCSANDLSQWPNFIHRSYVYPPGVGAVSSQ